MPTNWSGGAQGALGGGLAGASIGSLGGPVGTAIGAGVGAIAGGAMGLFGGGGQDPGMTDQERQMYMEYLKHVQSREAPQLAGTFTAGQGAQASNSALRSNQANLITQLESVASGKGPSLATEQLKAGADRFGRQQQSFANSARGSAVPLAQFQAMNNAAMLGAQATQDAGAARIAEITAAQNQLGLTLHGARGADEATSRFNAGQRNDMSRFNADAQNATARANLEAQLRAMGLNDEAIARAMATFQGTPQQASMGEQLLAGGAGTIGLLAQTRAGQAVKQPQARRISPSETMNPYAV